MRKLIFGTWKQAVEHMEKGGKIGRKGWYVDDYLYMENGVLKDDGGNEFLPRLSGTSGKWILY